MNDPLRQRLDSDRNTSGETRGSVFLLIFGIFWCASVGLFDFMILRSFIPQVESTWFKPVPAHILKSETTTSHDGDDGPTHGVAFEYSYSVDGKTYTGHRYTFDKTKSSDRRWTREAISAFPTNSERICYYDPRDPTRAVLTPGIHGSDITMLMFMTPFNIVAGFFLAYPFWAWRERHGAAIIPRISDRILNREAYAMNTYNPLLTFIVVFLLTSFVGIFAVVFTGGFHPSLTKVVTIWGVGFAIAVGASIYVYIQTKSGRYDLVFDQNSRAITVPAMHKRKDVESIPMTDVKKFDITKVETGSGDDHKITWHVKLLARDDREILLRETYLEPDAERLTNTLNAKLKA